MQLASRGVTLRVGQSVIGLFKVFFRLFHQSLQERPAPTAASTCAKTVAQLARFDRPVDTDIVHHFAFGDVKTEAQIVVEFHRYLPLGVSQASEIATRQASR